jgi:sugar phosphate isomerase/epimerase
MRISVVLSTHAARFDALALREDFEGSVARIASLGYDGVELAVRDPALLDVPRVKTVLARHRLAVPAIGTGQAWGEEGLSFTDPDPAIRRRAVDRILAQVAFARSLGRPPSTGGWGGHPPIVIIGLIRGRLAVGLSREQAEAWLVEALRECTAADPAVRLAVEPINRYETDLVNCVDEALQLIDRVGADNLGVLFDTFHANIEEPSVTGGLRAAGNRIFHVHTADSNRWYPGAGHVDFLAVVRTLRDLGYSGWLSAEILPRPDPATATARAAEHLRQIAGGEN